MANHQVFSGGNKSGSGEGEKIIWSVGILEGSEFFLTLPFGIMFSH